MSIPMAALEPGSLPPVGGCSHCPLRRLDVFESSSPGEIAVIEALKRAEVDHDAGDILIAEGGDDAPLYTVLAGWAIRYKTLADGRRQILNVMLPGDFIGLQQRMSDAANHGVQALTPVRLCRFARDAVWTLHRERPSLGYDVTWLSANEGSLVDDNLLSVGQRTALERLAAVLLTLYERARHFDPLTESEGLYMPLTQRHLSDLLGLSLAHTHRTMRRLQQMGLYTMAPGSRMVLPRPGALARLGQLRWPLLQARRPLI
jgi:CRP/FNR family transcriptional regulator, anaerobic regulatory protein